MIHLNTMNDTTSLDDIIGNLTDLECDLRELADAFGRTGNNHVADQLRRMSRFLSENVVELNNRNP